VSIQTFILMRESRGTKVTRKHNNRTLLSTHNSKFFRMKPLKAPLFATVESGYNNIILHRFLVFNPTVKHVFRRLRTKYCHLHIS
jgi:hypothetical protein